MRLLFLFILIVLSNLFSCNKDVKVMKRIKGNWEIVKYSQTDANSFTKPIFAKGYFKFNSIANNKAIGEYEYKYFFGDSLNKNVNSSGSYLSNYKDEALYLQPNINQSMKQKFHIDILTTSDAILEYNDLDFIHRFVLKKTN